VNLAKVAMAASLAALQGCAATAGTDHQVSVVSPSASVPARAVRTAHFQRLGML